MADILKKEAPQGVQWHVERMPEETYGTIYQPAALKAFRDVFRPAAAIK